MLYSSYLLNTYILCTSMLEKIKWWLLLVYKLCCESVLSNFILVLPRNKSPVHQVCTHCISGDSLAQYVASIAFLFHVLTGNIASMWHRLVSKKLCPAWLSVTALETDKQRRRRRRGLPSHLFSVLVSSPPKSFTFHHLHEAVDVDLQQCVGSVGEHLAKE